MAKNKRSTGVTILIILFMVSVCFLIITVIWGTDQVLTSVSNLYGEADPDLSFIDKTRLSFELYFYGDSLFFTPTLLNAEMLFEVESGQSIYDISNQLQLNGYIKEQESFINFIIYRGYDRRIQTGQFVISEGMNAMDIANKLINPIPEKVPFVILPGWRAEEIADALIYSGLSITKEEFLSAVNHPPASWLPDGFPLITSLEGYLAPGEYLFDRDINNAEFIRSFLDRFDENLSGELESSLLDQGYSIQEAVILASVVEREAVIDDEMPLIASVFLNRYEIGMKLDSDPTVQYALGYSLEQGSWWKNPLTYSDLQIDSPYNTYLYAQLPPGAICNPSLTALQAIAYAAETPYYYFRAKCDGSGYHEFSVTYEEHLTNGCE